MTTDQAETPRPPTQRKHVLVVDDDELVRIVVQEIFERIGCTVSSAANGKQALIEIAAKKPDLLILDVIMPEKEGIGTLLQVKREHSDIKTIVISGGGRKKIDDFLIIAERFGADAVLKKPIQQSVLVTHAAQLLWGVSVEDCQSFLNAR